jgi:hypothetical protein
MNGHRGGGRDHAERMMQFAAVPLESVHPILFSEGMRDLHLVVTVAHAGVGPEATASTSEMRAALIRETARLLKLTNISFATGVPSGHGHRAELSTLP